MRKARIGDTVSLHYTGRLLDGTIFDTTSGEDPLTVTLGQNDLIDGLAEAILGMSVGEQKTITLAPDKAHGERNDDSLIEIDRADMDGEVELQIGDELEVTDEDDVSFLAVVSAIDDETVTLDCASPLAGETLVFDLELTGIE